MHSAGAIIAALQRRAAADAHPLDRERKGVRVAIGEQHDLRRVVRPPIVETSTATQAAAAAAAAIATIAAAIAATAAAIAAAAAAIAAATAEAAAAAEACAGAEAAAAAEAAARGAATGDAGHAATAAQQRFRAAGRRRGRGIDLQRLVVDHDLVALDQEPKLQTRRQPAQTQRVIDSLRTPLHQTIVIKGKAIAVRAAADAVSKRQHRAASPCIRDQGAEPIALLFERAVLAGGAQT